MTSHGPHIVIVGGGFGGIAAAKALAKATAHVTLIDRNNHHVFQPLLYQVATSVLTPGQIGAPLREIVAKELNVTVIMGEVTGVDKEARCVVVNSPDREGVRIGYDYLVLATGVRHSYFGHDEFARFAPGLKGLADAVAIRNKILAAFEQAEAEEDPSKHHCGRNSGRIDPTSARIILVDRANRILGTFPERLSTKAAKRLEKLGVEVRSNHGVDNIDADGVIVDGQRIASKTVIWTAGVAPSPAGKWLGVTTDHAGRVRVEKDCSVPGHSEIFVIGDTASLDQNGKPLPGVAQVAIQQGRYVGKLLNRRLADEPPPPAFRYRDKGNMAVVGKGFAIVQTGPFKLSGYLAWLAWALVHIRFLALRSMRVSVFVQWVWTYLTGSRGSRLIVNHNAPSPRDPVATVQPQAVVSRPAVTNTTNENHVEEAPLDARGNRSPVRDTARVR